MNATVRQTSVRLLALQAGRTWPELFATPPDFTEDLVNSGDPYEMLPVIRLGVEMENLYSVVYPVRFWHEKRGHDLLVTP